MQKNSGFSLIGMLISLGVVAVLASLGGRHSFFALMTGQASNEMLREIAKVHASHICENRYSKAPLNSCVDFGKSACSSVAQNVIFRCLMQHRESVPPVLSLEEQKYLMHTASNCINTSWNKLLTSEFKLNLNKPECLKYQANYKFQK